MELWNKTLSSLRERVEPYDFKHWIAPVQCDRLDEGGRTIVLSVPDDSHGRWLEEHFVGEIKSALKRITDDDYDVSFTSSLDGPGEARGAAAPTSNAHGSSRVAEPTSSASGARRPMANHDAHDRGHDAPSREASQDVEGPTVWPTLVDRYRFASFVDGPTNQFAMSAARGVADHPGTLYNPLFIFGGVGLGKTHLLHAVGHAVLGKNPRARVRYVTSEQYVNDLIAGIQRNEMNQFRARYRDNCDVLLVDDIQFIAGKDRSQEEFFHMFNTLHSLHKQIVLTCDQLPQSIPDMEDRLKSRLQWGLIADIKPPGFETRVAILKRKAEADGVDLPDDVAMVVARHVTRNVRELEGALMRLVATAKMMNRPLDVDLAHQALGNIIGKTLERIAPDTVLKAVCAEYKVSPSELKGPRRHRNITVPRQIAMYLVRELTDESLPQIGAFFGGRDHSTVINSLKRVEALRDANPEIRAQIDRVRRSLRD
ncbi:MAG: chromosomal replication initiator protein DnaA [Myxococcota bacterium]